MTQIDLRLGKTVPTPESYDASVLVPIARTSSRRRARMRVANLPFHGFDVWRDFEFTSLTIAGKPRFGEIRLVISAQAPNTIESKSMKLYLASFAQERTDDASAQVEQIRKDVTRVCGAEIDVAYCPWRKSANDVEKFVDARVTCLDRHRIAPRFYTPRPSLLAAQSSVKVSRRIYSRLFRCLCPVTGQPDTATISVGYQGHRIDEQKLLEYFISFRQHRIFHEALIERMSMEISHAIRLDYLAICGSFARRGGIAIDVFRSSREEAMPNWIVRHP